MVCYYITYLSQTFTAAKRIRNYFSEVRFLHRQLGLTHEVLDSFAVNCLLHAADLTMSTLLLCHLPIVPTRLNNLCSLTSSISMLGPSMKVCLAVAILAC